MTTKLPSTRPELFVKFENRQNVKPTHAGGVSRLAGALRHGRFTNELAKRPTTWRFRPFWVIQKRLWRETS